MAKLTAAERDALPASDFVFPKTRQFPIHDRNHAIAALRDCARANACGPVRAAVKARYGIVVPGK